MLKRASLFDDQSICLLKTTMCSEIICCVEKNRVFEKSVCSRAGVFRKESFVLKSMFLFKSRFVLKSMCFCLKRAYSLKRVGVCLNIAMFLEKSGLFWERVVVC